MAKKAVASRPSKAVVANLLTPVQEFIRTESASGVASDRCRSAGLRVGKLALGGTFLRFARPTFQPASRRLDAWKSRCCSGSTIC